jgi:transcriptional regulator with XRE-family HTH domain
VREPEGVTGLRRELGRQLAEARERAGLVQRELAHLVGYSRSAVGNAETGSTKLGRALWERADAALATGEQFARGYDQIQVKKAEEEARGWGGDTATAWAAWWRGAGRWRGADR